MITLKYTISKAEHDYLVYLDANDLDVDENIKIVLESFAFSLSNKTNIETLICNKLHKLLESCWDFSYGIPIVTLSGDTKNIDQVFLGRPIIIFFSRGDLTNEKNIWVNEIKYIPKFIFVADCNESLIEISTTDHQYVYGYLDCAKKYNSRKQTVDKITITTKQWFGDDYEFIYSKCKQRIDEFVIAHKLDVSIPGFMFVESDWARRYQKALSMLNDKFHPWLIMTLPVILEDKQYTVLFPIMEQLSKNIYKGL